MVKCNQTTKEQYPNNAKKIKATPNFSPINLTSTTYNELARFMLKFNDDLSGTIIQNHASCPTCNLHFSNNGRCSVRQFRNKLCQVYYKLNKSTPLNSPNNNCNTIWYCGKKLQKHIQFHRHLTNIENNNWILTNQITILLIKSTLRISINMDYPMATNSFITDLLNIFILRKHGNANSVTIKLVNIIGGRYMGMLDLNIIIMHVRTSQIP